MPIKSNHFKHSTDRLAESILGTRVRAVIVCLCLMMTLSCSREDLYYEIVCRNNVQINVDWSKTSFFSEGDVNASRNPLNGVTIVAYDAATGKLVAELPPQTDLKHPLFHLDEGTYHLLVFNDTRMELPAIQLGLDRLFDDADASAVTTDTVREYPDYMTISAIRDVTILPSHKDYFLSRPDQYYWDVVAQEINTVQFPVTKRINIIVNVKGMNYCKGMQPSYMTGLAPSVILTTRKPSRKEVVYSFNLVNRQYRNSSYTEAVLSQSFNSFGFSEENLRSGTQFKLILNFVLVDNSVYTVTADVTPQLEKWLEEHTIDFDLDLDIDLDLEVTLPPTSPESSSIGGLDPEILPWNDIKQEIIL